MPTRMSLEDFKGWLAQLTEYERQHGDCNVPQKWAEEPRLGSWVSSQRKGKKKLDCGDPRPRITAERVAKLEALGFTWKVSAAVVRK